MLVMRYRLRPRYLQQEKKIRLEVGSNILIVVVKGSEWCVYVYLSRPPGLTPRAVSYIVTCRQPVYTCL